MTAIPDGLPSLARGDHEPGAGKACVMEYVSVITGCEFSDHPDSTYLPIALAAQILNDTLADRDRHLIAQFMHRLAAAHPPLTYEQGQKAGEWMRSINPDRDDEYTLWSMMGEKVGRAFVEEGAKYGEDGPVIGPILARKYDPDAGIAFMEHILTTYEQTMGITPDPIPTEALAKARVLIETRMAGV